MTDEFDPKILIPIIRRVMPSLIATDIINAQPMMGLSEKYRVIKTEGRDGQMWYHVICNDEIWQWVIDTVDKDQYADLTNDFQNKFIIDEETMMMIKLKYS